MPKEGRGGRGRNTDPGLDTGNTSSRIRLEAAFPLLDKVRDAVAVWSRAQRDFVTYPRNNPIVLKRREELMAAFAPILAEAPTLTIDVTSEDLRYEGISVYRSADRFESIAFRLYRNGIRQIHFSRGIRVEELDAVIDAINADSGEEADDDLLTILWERDAPHFQYDAVAAESDAGATWLEDPGGTLRAHVGSQREIAGNAKFVNAIRLEGGRPARDPRDDMAGILLDEKDVARLKTLLEEDEKRDLTIQIIDILLAVLARATDHAEQRDVLRILERVIEISILERNFNRAATALEKLTDLAAANSAFANALATVENHFQQAKQIRLVVEAVGKAEVEFEELDLFRYLIQLTKAGALALAEGMGQLDDRKARRVFCEAIAELIKDDVGVLAGLSRDGRWFVARNVAFIMGLTRNPDALPILRSLAAHPSEKVRAEAVRSAAQLGGVSREIVHGGLSDSDRLVRMLSCDLAVGLADGTTATPLLAEIQGKDFEARETAEKRAFCIALAKVSGKHALAPLSAFLVRRGAFLSGREESRAAAAAGIAAIGTSEALDYLRQGMASGDPALAAVCERALAEAKLR